MKGKNKELFRAKWCKKSRQSHGLEMNLTHFCLSLLCSALRFIIIILNQRLSTYIFRISLKYVSYINKKDLKSNNIEVTKVIQGQPFEYNRDNTSATHWFTFADIEMCLSVVWWCDDEICHSLRRKKLIGFCKSVYTINITINRFFGLYNGFL